MERCALILPLHLFSASLCLFEAAMALASFEEEEEDLPRHEVELLGTDQGKRRVPLYNEGKWVKWVS